MSRRTINLNPSIYRYLVDHAVREHPVLAELRAFTAGLPGARMQIGPEQGQFMALLARLIGARRCLEIGTYTGYSAMVVAMALPADGTVTCCEQDAEVIGHARRFWQKGGVAARIHVMPGDATASLDTLLAQRAAGGAAAGATDNAVAPFDMAFIDADKQGYEGYYQRCLKLLRPGGLILVDNVLWGGRVADESVSDAATVALRAFNTARLADDRVDLGMVPIGDGLTLLRKRG